VGAASDHQRFVVRTIRTLETVVRWLAQAAMAASAIVLAAIFAVISYSVVMRYFFGQPKPWIDEAVGWMLAVCVMLAVPEVQRRGEHIGIDFMAQKTGPRGRRALLIRGVTMVLATATLFVWQGLIMVQFSHMLNVLSNQLPEVPLWLVQACVPFGFALVALVAAVQLLCLLAGIAPRDMAEQVKEEI
jgi:C4-dicarboxylate transporter, DctQ subunit